MFEVDVLIFLTSGFRVSTSHFRAVLEFIVRREDDVFAGPQALDDVEIAFAFLAAEVEFTQFGASLVDDPGLGEGVADLEEAVARGEDLVASG
jgi:hypothetical protein